MGEIRFFRLDRSRVPRNLGKLPYEGSFSVLGELRQGQQSFD